MTTTQSIHIKATDKFGSDMEFNLPNITPDITRRMLNNLGVEYTEHDAFNFSIDFENHGREFIWDCIEQIEMINSLLGSDL